MLFEPAFYSSRTIYLQFSNNTLKIQHYFCIILLVQIKNKAFQTGKDDVMQKSKIDRSYIKITTIIAKIARVVNGYWVNLHKANCLIRLKALKSVAMMKRYLLRFLV